MNKKSIPIRRGIKPISLGLALVFAVTSVTWNAPVVAASSDVVVSSFAAIDKLTIPPEMGTISKLSLRGQESGGRREEGARPGSPSSIHHPPSGNFVILIQDAHAVTHAQENIRNILGHLRKNYGVRLGAIEGAKGHLEPVLMRAFPEAATKRKILASYEKRAELSGPEMAAVLEEESMDFRGMEDWGLYEQNYFAYLRAQEKKGSLLSRWNAFKQELDTERAKLYDSNLGEFQAVREDFLAERVSLLDLLVYLSRFKGLIAGKGGAYQELPGLIASIGYERSGKQEALAALVREVADEFKSKYLRSLGVKAEMNFYNRYQAFMTGQITAGQMLQYLVQVGSENGKSVRLTPELKKLLGHTELLSEIKGSRLHEELQRFLLDVESSLIKTAAQRELADMYQKLFLMKDMINLELSFDDLAEFRSKFPELDRRPLSQRGKKGDFQAKGSDVAKNLPQPLFSKEGGSLANDPDFRKDLAPALEFYDAALKRDRSFMTKLQEMMKETRQSTLAVVAGGFHTNGLEALLKEQDIAYAIVTPRISSLAGQENYFKVMQGDLSFRDYLKTTYFDALMRHASKALVEALPLTDRVRTLKLWRDNLIRALAQEGRITDAGKLLPYIDEWLQRGGEVVSVSPARSKAELLKIVRTELEKFKKDSIQNLWKTFEFQLGLFTDGLKQLILKKDLSAGTVATLLDSISSSKPSMLAAAASNGLFPAIDVLDIQHRPAPMTTPIVDATASVRSDIRQGKEPRSDRDARVWQELEQEGAAVLGKLRDLLKVSLSRLPEQGLTEAILRDLLRDRYAEVNALIRQYSEIKVRQTLFAPSGQGDYLELLRRDAAGCALCRFINGALAGALSDLNVEFSHGVFYKDAVTDETRSEIVPSKDFAAFEKKNPSILHIYTVVNGIAIDIDAGQFMESYKRKTAVMDNQDWEEMIREIFRQIRDFPNMAAESIYQAVRGREYAALRLWASEASDPRAALPSRLSESSIRSLIRTFELQSEEVSSSLKSMIEFRYAGDMVYALAVAAAEMEATGRASLEAAVPIQMQGLPADAHDSLAETSTLSLVGKRDESGAIHWSFELQIPPTFFKGLLGDHEAAASSVFRGTARAETRMTLAEIGGAVVSAEDDVSRVAAEITAARKTDDAARELREGLAEVLVVMLPGTSTLIMGPRYVIRNGKRFYSTHEELSSAAGYRGELNQLIRLSLFFRLDSGRFSELLPVPSAGYGIVSEAESREAMKQLIRVLSDALVVSGSGSRESVLGATMMNPFGDGEVTLREFLAENLARSDIRKTQWEPEIEALPAGWERVLKEPETDSVDLTDRNAYPVGSLIYFEGEKIYGTPVGYLVQILDGGETRLWNTSSAEEWCFRGSAMNFKAESVKLRSAWGDFAERLGLRPKEQWPQYGIVTSKAVTVMPAFTGETKNGAEDPMALLLARMFHPSKIRVLAASRAEVRKLEQGDLFESDIIQTPGASFLGPIDLPYYLTEKGLASGVVVRSDEGELRIPGVNYAHAIHQLSPSGTGLTKQREFHALGDPSNEPVTLERVLNGEIWFNPDPKLRFFEVVPDHQRPQIDAIASVGDSRLEVKRSDVREERMRKARVLLFYPDPTHRRSLRDEVSEIVLNADGTVTERIGKLELPSEDDPSRKSLSLRERANLGVLSALMQRGEITPQEFYRLMAEVIDPRVKVRADLGEENGAAALALVEKGLGPEFISLLVEPGIALRAEDFVKSEKFEQFIRDRGLQRADLGPLEQRDLYETFLGARTVFRGMYVSAEEIEKMISGGMMHSTAFESGVRSMDLQKIADFYRAHPGQNVSIGEMEEGELREEMRKFFFFTWTVAEGFISRAVAKAEGDSDSALLSVTAIEQLAKDILNKNGNLIGATYRRPDILPFVTAWEMPNVYLLPQPFKVLSEDGTDSSWARGIRTSDGKMYDRNDSEQGVEIFVEVLAQPDWLKKADRIEASTKGFEWQHWPSKGRSEIRGRALQIFLMVGLMAVVPFVTQGAQKFAVASIPKASIQTVQKELGVEQVGVIGPKTIAALQKRGGFQFKSGKFDPQTRAVFDWVLREVQTRERSAGKVNASVKSVPDVKVPVAIVPAATPLETLKSADSEMPSQRMDELVEALLYMDLIKEEDAGEVRSNERIRKIKIRMLQKAIGMPEKLWTGFFGDKTRAQFAEVKAGRMAAEALSGSVGAQGSVMPVIRVTKEGAEPVSPEDPVVKSLGISAHAALYEKLFKGFRDYGLKLWSVEKQKDLVTLGIVAELMTREAPTEDQKDELERVRKLAARQDLGSMRMGISTIEGGKGLATNQKGGPAASSEMIEPRSAIDAVRAAGFSKNPDVLSVLYDGLTKDQKSFVTSLLRKDANQDANRSKMWAFLQDSDFQNRVVILYLHWRLSIYKLPLPSSENLQQQAGTYQIAWAPGIFEYPRTLGHFLYANAVYDVLEKLSRGDKLTDLDRKSLSQADSFSARVETIATDMRKAQRAAMKKDFSKAKILMAEADQKYVKLLAVMNQLELVPERFMVTWKLRDEMDRRNARLKAGLVPQTREGLPAVVDLRSMGLPLAMLAGARSELRKRGEMLPADKTSYRLESFLDRGLDNLNANLYGGELLKEIDQRIAVAKKPVEILLIGVGRGREAIELQKRYGDKVRVVAVNKEAGELFDLEGYKSWAGRNAMTLTSEDLASFEKVRQNLKVMDVESQLADLTDKFDMAVIGFGVGEYFGDRVKVYNEIVSRQLVSGGSLYASLGNIRIQAADGSSHPGLVWMYSLPAVGSIANVGAGVRIAQGQVLPFVHVGNERKVNSGGVSYNLSTYALRSDVRADATAMFKSLPNDPRQWATPEGAEAYAAKVAGMSDAAFGDALRKFFENKTSIVPINERKLLEFRGDEFLNAFWEHFLSPTKNMPLPFSEALHYVDHAQELPLVRLVVSDYDKQLREYRVLLRELLMRKGGATTAPVRSDLRASTEDPELIAAMKDVGGSNVWGSEETNNKIRIYPQNGAIVEASPTDVYHLLVRIVNGRPELSFQRFEKDPSAKVGSVYSSQKEQVMFGRAQWFNGKRDGGMASLHFIVGYGQDEKGLFLDIEDQSFEWMKREAGRPQSAGEVAVARSPGIAVRWEPLTKTGVETVFSKKAGPREEAGLWDDEDTPGTLDAVDYRTMPGAFSPEVASVDHRLFENIIATDVPAFSVVAGGVFRNPGYQNPVVADNPATRASTATALGEVERALKAVVGESPEYAELLSKSENGWMLGDEFVSDCITHKIHALNEKNYKYRNLTLREFIREYLKEMVRYSMIEETDHEKRLAKESGLAQDYVYFARLNKLRDHPEGKLAVLFSAGLKSPEVAYKLNADPRTCDPEVMTVLGIYQPGRGRRAMIDDQLVILDPENILLVQWKGRTFIFYTSRSHTVGGVTARQWRHAEAYWIRPQGGGWLVKDVPENVDDLPPQLGAVLDNVLDEQGKGEREKDRDAFMKKITELGLLNFSDWDSLEKIFHGEDQKSSGLLDFFSKENPQMKNARDYVRRRKGAAAEDAVTFTLGRVWKSLNGADRVLQIQCRLLSRNMLEVVVLLDGTAVRHVLSSSQYRGPIVIGRNSQGPVSFAAGRSERLVKDLNDRLSKAGVSREHLNIVWTGRQWWVVPQAGATGKTYLNGELLPEQGVAIDAAIREARSELRKGAERPELSAGIGMRQGAGGISSMVTRTLRTLPFLIVSSAFAGEVSFRAQALDVFVGFLMASFVLSLAGGFLYVVQGLFRLLTFKLFSLNDSFLRRSATSALLFAAKHAGFDPLRNYLQRLAMKIKIETIRESRRLGPKAMRQALVDLSGSDPSLLISAFKKMELSDFQILKYKDVQERVACLSDALATVFQVRKKQGKDLLRFTKPLGSVLLYLRKYSMSADFRAVFQAVGVAALPDLLSRLGTIKGRGSRAFQYREALVEAISDSLHESNSLEPRLAETVIAHLCEVLRYDRGKSGETAAALRSLANKVPSEEFAPAVAPLFNALKQAYEKNDAGYSFTAALEVIHNDEVAQLARGMLEDRNRVLSPAQRTGLGHLLAVSLENADEGSVRWAVKQLLEGMQRQALPEDVSLFRAQCENLLPLADRMNPAEASQALALIHRVLSDPQALAPLSKLAALNHAQTIAQFIAKVASKIQDPGMLRTSIDYLMSRLKQADAAQDNGYELLARAIILLARQGAVLDPGFDRVAILELATESVLIRPADGYKSSFMGSILAYMEIVSEIIENVDIAPDQTAARLLIDNMRRIIRFPRTFFPDFEARRAEVIDRALTTALDRVPEMCSPLIAEVSKASNMTQESLADFLTRVIRHPAVSVELRDQAFQELTAAASKSNRSAIAAIMQMIFDPALSHDFKVVVLDALSKIIGRPMEPAEQEKLIRLSQDYPEFNELFSQVVNYDLMNDSAVSLFFRYGLDSEPRESILFLKDMAAFFSLDDNQKNHEAKVRLIRAISYKGYSPRILSLIKEAFEKEKHENRLEFLRRLTHFVQSDAMALGDSFEDWQTIFEDYSKRFGFSATRALVSAHRYLSRGEDPVTGSHLADYKLGELGVDQTGEAGLKQLQELFQKTMAGIHDAGDITDADLGNPLLDNILGMLTGYYTVQWSHASAWGIGLGEFSGRFRQLQREGKIPELKPAFKVEHSFDVGQTSDVALTPEEENVFSRYFNSQNPQSVLSRALALSGKTSGEQLEMLREQAAEKLNQKIQAAEASLNKPDLGEKARNSINTKIASLRKVLSDIGSDETLLAFVQRLVSIKELNDSREVRDDIAVVLFLAAFEKPGQKEALLAALQLGSTRKKLEYALEFKADFIKEHVLDQITDKDMKKRLLQSIDIGALTSRLLDQGPFTGEKTKIRAYTTKGLLGELAASIGNACYSKSENGFIMARTAPSPITAVIFESGEGPTLQLAGSMLILENSVNGRPVLIMRALNPSSEENAEDMINGAIQLVEKIAENIERETGDKPLIVAPLGQAGSLSNRSGINDTFKTFAVGVGTLTLEKEETFNGFGHDMTAGVISEVMSRTLPSARSEIRKEGDQDEADTVGRADLRRELAGGIQAPERIKNEKEYFADWDARLKRAKDKDREAIVAFARKVVANGEVVTKEAFLTQLAETKRSLEGALEKAGPYAVLFGRPHTSRRWAWSLMNEGLKPPAFTTYVEPMKPYYENLMRRRESLGVRTFVIADDACYSAQQIIETLRDVAKRYPTSKVIVSVPYMTAYAVKSIQAALKDLPKGFSVEILPHKTMKTLDEILSQDEKTLFERRGDVLGKAFGNDKSYSSRVRTTVSLFAHKFADQWSVYQLFAQFFKTPVPPYKAPESAYYKAESDEYAAEVSKGLSDPSKRSDVRRSDVRNEAFTFSQRVRAAMLYAKRYSLSSDEYYRALPDYIDPAKKVRIDLLDERGQKSIDETTEQLGPEFVRLLGEPGVSTRTSQFIEFAKPIVGKMRASGQAITSEQVWDVRMKFKKYLGDRQVFRTVWLNNRDLEAVRQKGMESNRARSFKRWWGPVSEAELAAFEAKFGAAEDPVGAAFKEAGKDRAIMEFISNASDIYRGGSLVGAMSRIYGGASISDLLSVTQYGEVALSAGSQYVSDNDKKRRKLYLFKINMPALYLLEPNEEYFPKFAPVFDKANITTEYVVTNTKTGEVKRLNNVTDSSIEMFVERELAPEWLASASEVLENPYKVDQLRPVYADWWAQFVKQQSGQQGQHSVAGELPLPAGGRYKVLWGPEEQSPAVDDQPIAAGHGKGRVKEQTEGKKEPLVVDGIRPEIRSEQRVGTKVSQVASVETELGQGRQGQKEKATTVTAPFLFASPKAPAKVLLEALGIEIQKAKMEPVTGFSTEDATDFSVTRVDTKDRDDMMVDVFSRLYLHSQKAGFGQVDIYSYKHYPVAIGLRVDAKTVVYSSLLPLLEGEPNPSNRVADALDLQGRMGRLDEGTTRFLPLDSYMGSQKDSDFRYLQGYRYAQTRFYWQWGYGVYPIPQFSGVWPHLGNYRTFVDALLEFSLPNFKKGSKALVIGTGSGVEAVELAKRGASVDAVDIKPMAVAATQASALVTETDSRIKVWQSDGFKNVTGKYDAIFATLPMPDSQALPGDETLDKNEYDAGEVLMNHVLDNFPKFMSPGGKLYLMLAMDEERMNQLKEERPQLLFNVLHADPHPFFILEITSKEKPLGAINALSLLQAGKLDASAISQQMWEVYRSAVPEAQESFTASEIDEREQRNKMRVEKGEITAVFQDGRMAGYIVHEVDAARNRGYVAMMAVRKEFQGRDIGRTLMDAAGQWFREHQLSSVLIEPEFGSGSFLNKYFGVQDFKNADGRDVGRRIVKMTEWPGAAGAETRELPEDTRGPKITSEAISVPLGGLVKMDARKISEDAALKGPDVVRNELREKGKVVMEGIRAELSARGEEFIAAVAKQSDLAAYLGRNEFQTDAQRVLGSFGDVENFVSGVRTALLPTALAAEIVDPAVARIIPEQLSALDATLETRGGNLTLAFDLSTPGGEESIKQFLSIPSERTSRVNELAVSGVLAGSLGSALRTRNITVRTAKWNRSFVPRNDQASVPFVTADPSAGKAAVKIFDPLTGDMATVKDPLIRDFMNRLMVVAAIHLADIKAHQKSRAGAMTAGEIRDELLRRLNLTEQKALIEVQGRGFRISSVAVQVYLEMKAKESIDQAA